MEYKQDYLPGFFGGPASVISGDILGKLYLLTIEVEVSSIFMDNVNVTVMCREYIEVLSVEHLGSLCLVGIYELLKLNPMTPYLSGELKCTWMQSNDNLQCHLYN